VVTPEQLLPDVPPHVLAAVEATHATETEPSSAGTRRSGIPRRIRKSRSPAGMTS